jgi:hypothetical protein
MGNSGCKDGKKKAKKAEQTEAAEGGRQMRENQNLEVSCTDFVHASSPSTRGHHSHVPGSPGTGPQDKLCTFSMSSGAVSLAGSTASG